MQLGQVGGRRRIVELAAVEPPGAAAEQSATPERGQSGQHKHDRRALDASVEQPDRRT